MALMNPGGTQGGNGLFAAGMGLVLAALGMYLFFDSVRVTAGNYGWVSGWLGGYMGSFQSTSMGVIFVPFMLGVATLFFDASKKWAWALTIVGLAIIALEILSRIRFEMNMKTSHLLMILAMIAAGFGMLARSFKDGSWNSQQK